MAYGSTLLSSAIGLASKLPDRFGRPATSTGYIPQIDGLRFLAILIVLLWHISLRADRFVDALNKTALDHANACQSRCRVAELYAWFPHGEIGVALFFFVSGFIIAQPFLMKPKSRWAIGQFYGRRLRRIYPPYLIALTLCLVTVSASNYHGNPGSPSIWSSYFAGVFYLNGLVYDQSSSLNPPMWSLEVEAQFYLLAPALLAFYLKPGRLDHRLLIGCVAIVTAILCASVIDQRFHFDGRYRFGLLAHLYLFFSGIVIADWCRSFNPLSREATPAFDLMFVFGLLGLYLSGLWLTHVDAKPGGGVKDICSA
jgi:peptidoglycan/LPS O-acetylase OafA/YrhL